MPNTHHDFRVKILYTEFSSPFSEYRMPKTSGRLAGRQINMKRHFTNGQYFMYT